MGVCDRCGGDGRAHGSDRPFEWSSSDPYPGKCPKCEGSGKTGLTHWLFRELTRPWVGIRRRFRSLVVTLRFGDIQSRVVDQINGTASEIEYTDKRGRVVGYWAYGSFDPTLPYQGE